MSEIKINFSDKKIEAKVNKKALKNSHTTVKKVVDKLNKKKGFKVKYRGSKIYTDNSKLGFKELYRLKEKMKETLVSGIKNVTQVLVVKREREYVILAAGSNLKKVFKVDGINKDKTITNDLHEIAKVLGIEAARQAVINEVDKVLNQQGLDINKRHIKLIADAMTYKGDVKGVTRMGIISEKSSILARASFETPLKQFVNSTIKGSKDKLASVIENIILNQPVPVGTGLPGLLVEVTGPLDKKKKSKKKK